MIRGGHVDLTVLGALQVDEKGNAGELGDTGEDVKGHGRSNGPGGGSEAPVRDHGARDPGMGRRKF